MTAIVNRVRTPLFPLYRQVRQLLPLLDGVPRKAVTRLIKAIWDQTGTPQNPVDWSDPDTWIEERLAGENQELARRLWEGTEKAVNPRHLYGSYLFINNFDLLTTDPAGVFRLNERGREFLEGDDTAVVREIDDLEGLPQLLRMLASRSPARSGDLIDEWTDVLAAHSKWGTPSGARDTLRRRLANLVDRGYVSREGNVYAITQEGLRYAASSRSDASDPKADVLRAIKEYNDAQLAHLRDLLAQMPPHDFEHLVKNLLEAMDYEDVEVTKQSGDKGVDVVATFQFGITQIREVVQVKRHQGSITRPILDQLRGALPYHRAIRGTIITLGKFAKGCKDAALFPGAAPITLIDGDKLIELLIKHDVGIRRKQVSLIDVDLDFFATGTEPAAEPEEEEAMVKASIE